MTNLFRTISELVPRCHGWATVEKAFTLAGVALALRPEIIVEIGVWGGRSILDRKSTRLNSSHTVISYAVFCLKKKKITFRRYLVGEYLGAHVFGVRCAHSHSDSNDNGLILFEVSLIQ